jgi:hypothetical protein
MACRRVSNAKSTLICPAIEIARLKEMDGAKTATLRPPDEERIFLSSDNPAVRGIENHGNSD